MEGQLKIDVLGYLHSRGVNYREHGKNVGYNDINVCCPFCGETKFHLGINKIDGRLNCWVCGFEHLKKWPNFSDFIVETEKVDFSKAVGTLKDFTLDPNYQGNLVRTPERAEVAYLPRYTQPFQETNFVAERDAALAYLSSRGFGWTEVFRYRLQFCPKGKWSGRIIIPIYHYGKLVCYVGRDYTGLSNLRYDTCLRKMSVMSPSELLYGYDSFIDTKAKHGRLVEGPTDRWAIGNSSMATMTNKLSKAQRSLIVKSGVQTLSVIYDAGALSKAHSAAEMLSPVLDRIKVVGLGSGDPATLGTQAVMRLEHETPWLDL